MCVQIGFYVIGTIFPSFKSLIFAIKDIPWRVRIPMLDKILFRQSRFSLFFLQHVSLTYVPTVDWQITFSIDPVVMFLKRYTLV